MTYYEENLYYHPEKHGLEIFDMVEYPPCYDFDMCVVWRDVATDELFYAFDSGCSCPTPFENHSRKDLVLITPENYQIFKDAIIDWASISYRDKPNEADVVDVLKKVSGHIGW